MRLALLAALLCAAGRLNKHKLMCASCKAVSAELLLLLHDSTSEMDIDHFLDGFCHPDRFGRYDFPPPDMFMGCQRFLARHHEEFVAALMRRGSSQHFARDFCEGQLRLCGEAADAPEAQIDNYETYHVIHNEQ